MLLLTISLLVANVAFAYETLAVGQVKNKADKEPIPGVTIYFRGTSIGVQSNEEGYFRISTSGNDVALVFSCVGYKEREIKLAVGKSVGLEVELEEENNLLQEIFIVPGSNPALEWIKKIRLIIDENDVTKLDGFTTQSKEQNLVLLSKLNQKSTNKKLFEQLRKGSLSPTDSALTVPLYITENTFQITDKEKKMIKKDVFSTPEIGEKIITQLVGEIDTEINFYNNAVVIFGKSLISPLSKMGNAYYRYYLTDSVNMKSGKQYNIVFRSRNEKNLAFHGSFMFDSTTLAITNIEAELPPKANINFIRNLRIEQKFEQLANKRWTRQWESVSMNTSFDALADSQHARPEIFVKRTANYTTADTLLLPNEKFANSEYNQVTLNEKLSELNNTPMLRTAKWIADVVFTGYINLGKIDLGKVQQIARLTDIEGLRVNLPLRTNENLWKNISLGGYAGYAIGSKEAKYSIGGEYKLPGKIKRKIGISYTDDYRILNYEYNNFSYLENPLITGDIDIANTLFAFGSAPNLNARKEFLISFSNDWNSDVETNTFYRSNQIFGNEAMPMKNEIGQQLSLRYQSATVETRLSFGERTYEDHLQRLYINNNRPVLYAILELGKYEIGSKKANFGKLTALIKQKVRLNIGQFNYIAEGGYIIGNVPYPLLHIPYGNNTGGYSFQNFNLIRYMEYATDKYVSLHSELLFNGLFLNQIPIVKKLNLREICSFHFAYGGLDNKHNAVVDMPNTIDPLTKPYMEVGVGITNILHLFTIQSIWRLSDLNKENVVRQNIMVSFNIGF